MTQTSSEAATRAEETERQDELSGMAERDGTHPVLQSSNSLEQARRYIYGINFSRLKENMLRPERAAFSSGWSRRKLDYVEQQYKNWLYLARKHDGQGQMPPSADIDQFWHQHILDTKAYHEDCQAIFGRYRHHWPYFGSGEFGQGNDRSDLLVAREVTQQRYLAEFGELIYDYAEDEDSESQE